jgi:hypothetical protein
MSVGQEDEDEDEEEEEAAASGRRLGVLTVCQVGLYFVHLCPILYSVLYSVCTQTRTRALCMYTNTHARAHTDTPHTHTPDSYFSPCCNLFFQSIVVTYRILLVTYCNAFVTYCCNNYFCVKANIMFCDILL